MKIDRKGPSIGDDSTTDTELPKKNKVMAHALSNFPPSLEGHIPQLPGASQHSISTQWEAANDPAPSTSIHCDGHFLSGVGIASSPDQLQGEPMQTDSDHPPSILTIPWLDSAISSIKGQHSEGPRVISCQHEFKASNRSTIW